MKRGGKIFAWVLLGILFVALVTFVTQQLWNWLIPYIFKGPALTFWQTLGLLVLSKIIFSGFGRKHHHYGGHKFSWKDKFYQKFSSMSPEEREALKSRMKEKWCDFPKSSSEETPRSND